MVVVEVDDENDDVSPVVEVVVDDEVVVDGSGWVVVVVDASTADGADGGAEHSGGRSAGAPDGFTGVGPAPMHPNRDSVMWRVILVPSRNVASELDSRT